MRNRRYSAWRTGTGLHFCTVLVMSLGLWATPADAGLSSVTFEVTAQSSLGSALFQVTLGLTNYDIPTDTWSWSLSAPITLLDGLTPIATLNDATFTYVGDPQVSFGFSVTAMSADTVFSITSGLLSFAPLNSASGSASAGLLLTDVNGNGATLTGLGPTGGAYLSQYNGLAPGGTTFAELMVTPLAVGINGTTNTSDSFPSGGGFSAIGVLVSEISAQFNFQLTANDTASGSSNYVVIPAPGALGLLMIGLICPRRRRRHSH